MLATEGARIRFILGVLLLASSLALNGCSQEAKFKKYPVIYDFVQNFHLAEVQQEGTLIDFGSPPAHQHMRGGWSTDEGLGDATLVWGFGGKSVIEFFLSEAREIQMTFRCSPFRFPGAPVQTISISVNGQEVDKIILQPGSSDYQVVLPSHAVVAGKNRLDFHGLQTWRITEH